MYSREVHLECQSLQSTELNEIATSVIPQLGQFHVYLNVSEDIAQRYHTIFKEIYSAVFGGKIHEKPKPEKEAICLALTFCGWLQVRYPIIEAFGQCKDVEYVCLHHLFDEPILLAYLHYPVILKGGNFSFLTRSIMNLAIMFITMERHHYNKAKLSWISDAEYQRYNIPQYYQAKGNLCSLITEKKIEIFHSKLLTGNPDLTVP